MSTAAERATAIFWFLGGRSIRRCLAHADRRAQALSALSDDDLVLECQRLLSTPKLIHADSGSADLLRNIRGKDLTDQDANALAIAAEAFARFPPTPLPRGTRLHPQQLLTAVHLLRGSLVQMDTGEGKTFAISTAALALLRIHPRVYIVTANPYLAARDAANTEPFWSRLGISVGVGLPTEYANSDPSAWKQQVVYTTLSELAFRSLTEDLCEEGTERLMTWSAVLLDEVDAVLLEQSTRRRQRTRITTATMKDWSQPIAIAKALEEGHVKREFGSELSVRLTTEGEAHVMQLLEGQDQPLVDRLLLLHDIELAYAGIREARIGHDYDIQSGRVVTIDATSGWHTPGIDHAWVAPLEQELGVVAQPRSVVRTAVDGMTVLRRFDHMCGTSGTVLHEALTYALLVGLPPAVVHPRTPRHEGRLTDLYFGAREWAHAWVEEQVVTHGTSRPILIATDSTQEAGELATRLSASVPPGVTVKDASGETIAEERLFERAGKPGLTIVSTRTAGRGVDIVLEDEARQNGGAMLLALGHAAEQRLDRQLLGRVGRGGDPYTAIFINHADDALIRMLAEGKRSFEWLANAAGESFIESRRLDRAIAGAQRARARDRLRNYAQDVGQGLADADAYEAIREWRQQLGTQTDDVLPESFLQFAATRYLAARFPGLAFEDDASEIDSEPAAAAVAELVGRPSDENTLIVQTSGQPAQVVRERFSKHLAGALAEALRKNSEARARIAAEASIAERAAIDLRLLSFLRELVRSAGSDGDGSIAAGALRVAVTMGAEGSEFSSSGMEERTTAIERWLEEPNGASEDDLRSLGDADLDTDDALANLLGVAVAMVTHDEPPGASQCEAFDALLERAETARRASAATLTHRWWVQERRSGWRAADETIGHASNRLMTGLDQTRFRVAQTTPATRYARVYAARVADLEREVEATLATEMCTNLIVSSDPAALADLFAEREQAVQVHQPQLELELPALPSQPTARAARPEPTVSNDAMELIRHYVKAVEERLGEEAPDKRLLYPALNMLLKQSTLPTLTAPDRVADAYATWKGSGVRDELAPWRRRAIDRHVRGFLAFLYERGLAAPLPSGVAERSRSFVRRVRNVTKGVPFELGGAMLVLSAISILLLALVPHQDDLTLSPGLGFLDRLLTGGAIATGSAVGPAILALTSAAWLRWLLGFPLSSGSGVLPVERLASLVLLAAGVVAIVQPWHGGLALDTAGDLALCLALIFGGLALRNGVWLFEQISRSQLSVALCAALAGFSTLPFLVDLSGSASPLWVAAATAVILLASTPLRQTYIPVVALRVDPSAPDEAETLDVSRVVRGQLSIVAHAFAIVSAWAVTHFVVDAGQMTRSAMGALAYLAALAIWARGLARSATQPDEWRDQMRRRQQGYRPSDDKPTLQDALTAARRRVFALELATAVPLVAIGTWVAASLPDAVLRRFPVGLGALCATVIAVELGRAVVRNMRLPLSSSAAATDPFAEGETLGEYANAVRRGLAKRLAAILAVFIALSTVANARDVWELVTDIARWVSDLL